MAILVQLSQYSDLGRLPAERPQVLSMPPLLVERITAAGRTAGMEPEARLFRMRNMGDPIMLRVCKLTDLVEASPSNGESEYFDTGDILDFMLPNNAEVHLWCIDVRAA